MINDLQVVNYSSKINIEFKPGDQIQIETCQRTLLIGFNLYKETEPTSAQHYCGDKAYQFLLEVITGLQSKLVGENEIVAQFKEAYWSFQSQDYRNPLITSIMEKLFKDAKSIRSNYLTQIGQMSYASITRKCILQSNTSDNILITGSGKLTKELIKVLYKNSNIFISARNQTAVNLLMKQYPKIKKISWKSKDSFHKFSKVINTIGCDQILFNKDFFHLWKDYNKNANHLFIDLSNPSPIETNFNKYQNVIRLDNIFEMAKELNLKKNIKIDQAKLAIKEITNKRKLSYTLQFPYGWEELQFV